MDERQGPNKLTLDDSLLLKLSEFQNVVRENRKPTVSHREVAMKKIKITLKNTNTRRASSH